MVANVADLVVSDLGQSNLVGREITNLLLVQTGLTVATIIIIGGETERAVYCGNVLPI